MADETPADTPEPKSRRAKSGPPPVEPPAPVPDPAPAGVPAAPDGPAPEWLRYTGQTPLVFMDLGGEIEPGNVVRPRDAALVQLLLRRNDFQGAEAPTHDAANGTAS